MLTVQLKVPRTLIISGMGHIPSYQVAPIASTGIHPPSQNFVIFLIVGHATDEAYCSTSCDWSSCGVQLALDFTAICWTSVILVAIKTWTWREEPVNSSICFYHSYNEKREKESDSQRESQIRKEVGDPKNWNEEVGGAGANLITVTEKLVRLHKYVSGEVKKGSKGCATSRAL